jgi:hypothetical protein
MQNCAILRHTLQSGLGTFPYEKHAMQRNENLRNSLGLNYESPALTAELQAHIYCKTNYANGKIQKEQEQSEAQPDGA